MDLLHGVEFAIKSETASEVLDQQLTKTTITESEIMDENVKTELGELRAAIGVRHKKWDELTDGEKIERMRDEVKRLMHSLGYLRATVDKLEHHEHLNGTMVIPMRDQRMYAEEAIGRNVGYF